MTYLLTLTLPIAYQADDDDHARVIGEHIEDSIMQSSLPHDAEFLDADGHVLEHSLTGRQHLRTVVGESDFVARYAPLPATTGQGHPVCEACAGYIEASLLGKAAGATDDVELRVETREDDES